MRLPAKVFRRCVGPFVGAVVGALISLPSALRMERDIPWEWVLAGAAIGFVVGGFTWILDRTTINGDDEEVSEVDLDREESATLRLVPSSLLGRFLAMLSLIFCLFGGVGLLVSAAAVLINFRSKDWTRNLSLLSLSIAFVSCVVIILLSFVLPHY